MTTYIMPLGASNTYGMVQNVSSPGGYRGPLYDMLKAQGAEVNFVGLNRDGAIADPDHNGYSGKPIDWFINPVNETIIDNNFTFTKIDTQGRPAIHYLLEQANMTSADVVLLLAGTNDVRLGDSAET